MPALIKEIIDAIVGKLGGIKGYLAKKLLEYGGQYLVKLWDKLVRSSEQKVTEDKVQQDINEGKLRDEETRKNELDNLNS
jgi:hypothetical protein